MDRRAFLRTGLSVLPVVALAPLVGGCAGARPAKPAAPVAGPVGMPIPAPAALLEEFATRTGSRIVSDDLEAWLAGLDRVGQERAREVGAKMAEQGFSDYGGLKIFAKDDVVFYNVANVDRINACAPFWVEGRPGAMAEGPIVTGLTLAARDWPEAGTVSAAGGLIPIGTVQPEPGTDFRSTMTAPYIYRTAAGTLQVFYHAEPRAKSGTVSVVAKQEDEVLLSREYAIRWG